MASFKQKAHMFDKPRPRKFLKFFKSDETLYAHLNIYAKTKTTELSVSARGFVRAIG